MKKLDKKMQKKIKVEHVSIFTIQAPPQFCFSKLSDENIRRRAHKDVLTVQMEPEVGGRFVISCQKPTGTETVQMKITEYAPPSALKITAPGPDKDLSCTYRLKRIPSGTRMTVQMQFSIDRNWINAIIYLLFRKKLERKWNDYWQRLAVEIEKEFCQRQLL
ncbi:MAG: SRPBCC domain-containing protein [Thermoactinomyces sp.]